MNWGNTVNAEIANTVVSLEYNSQGHRNAYSLKLSKNILEEYNAGKSLRHLEQVKMYAELARIKKCKNQGIKSLWGNICEVTKPGNNGVIHSISY